MLMSTEVTITSGGLDGEHKGGVPMDEGEDEHEDEREGENEDKYNDDPRKRLKAGGGRAMRISSRP
jgi:hypothetical protein